MDTKKYDVIGIGNAIVDILTYTDESFLTKHELVKGAMSLVDEEKSAGLYKEIGQATEASGGSAANTIAGIASLGGSVGFIGKIADDQLGKIFSHDMNAIGVSFDTAPLVGGAATANCIVLVTGHGSEQEKVERTMATFLGATTELKEEDINPELIKAAKTIFIEGYLWDQKHVKDAIRKAMDIAHNNGVKVAFTLSDTFCVERHREEFLDLVENHIDILFSNEHEIKSLYQEQALDKIYPGLQQKCEVTIVTKSENGSTIISADRILDIKAEPTEVADVTGAGDLYAAGFLYGYAKNFDLEKCGKLASICAAEVLKTIGARPMTKLSDLASSI